ncbi:hypothetical protein D9M70_629900 [compost metagenome]
MLLERRAQRRHIAARTAFDHAPLRAVADRQQAVIVEEAQEELQGETEHVGQRHRPDRRPHRHYVVLDEALAVAALLEVVAEAGDGIDALLLQVVQRLAVET